MPRFEPIDANRCRNHGWRRFVSYQFAAGDSLVPVVADEIPHVLATMPMAFRPLPDGSYELVAVMSFQNRLNLFVHPVNGRWIGGYTPAAYRSYPFWSLPEKGSGRMVLCFDMDSGLYREAPGPEDSPFFDENDQMTPMLKDTAEFLQKFENQRRIVKQLTDVLAQQKLIVPWEIKSEDASGKPVPVEGLYKIDEKSLRKLSLDEMGTLQKTDALPLAYAQLFSQHRLPNLTRLHQLHDRLKDKTPGIDLEKILGQDDVFKFDN